LRLALPHPVSLARYVTHPPSLRQCVQRVLHFFDKATLPALGASCNLADCSHPVSLGSYLAHSNRSLSLFAGFRTHVSAWGRKTQKHAIIFPKGSSHILPVPCALCQSAGWLRAETPECATARFEDGCCPFLLSLRILYSVIPYFCVPERPATSIWLPARDKLTRKRDKSRARQVRTQGV
jgi:hypothetical protein